ncbi:MAG: alpha/beta hydrolase [Bacteroidota bacterium]|nr:alpha/beta hydrolase [Bacteroidota bacterium]
MKFITTTDKTSGEEVKLAYYDYGNGKPVILIHGWPLSKEMFEYQLNALIDAGLRVIAYDRRGFGKSDQPWNGYDYDTLTDDLKAVIDGLHLTDVTLVGFSMGGGEVARYFTKYGGENVSKAVLISSVVPYLPQTEDNPNGVPQDKLQEMADGAKQDRIGFLDAFGKHFFGISLMSYPVSAPLLEYYRMLASVASPRATMECMKAFAYTDFRNDAININVPTLIIHGDSDKTVPIEISGQRAAELIKNNQYLVYEGAPHGLFYTEKEKLNADLVSFIINGTTYSSQAPIRVILSGNTEGLVTR